MKKLLSGIQHECLKFDNILSKTYVKGNVFDGQSEPHKITEKGHFELNSGHCLISVLHKCPENTYKYYRNLRHKTPSVMSTVKLLDHARPSFSNIYIHSWSIKSISSPKVTPTTFAQVEKPSDEMGHYGIIGKDPSPVMGFLFDETSLNSFLNPVQHNPFTKMFLTHLAWILNCLSAQDLKTFQKKDDIKAFRGFNAVKITNVSSSAEIEKIVTGSCEIFEHNQAYECELSFQDQSWQDLAGEDVLYIKTDGIASDVVGGLKVTVNMKTYTYRFFPQTDCETNMLTRLDEELSKQTVLFQEITVTNINYFTPERTATNVRYVDDFGSPLVFHQYTVNAGLFNGGTLENKSPSALGFVFEYGMPMQYVLSGDYKSAYQQNIDIPSELAQASCLKGIKKFWQLTQAKNIYKERVNNLISDQTKENAKSFCIPLQEVLRGNHPEENNTIRHSITKNFETKKNSKQENKSETWEIHPSSYCKQKFGFLVQGPLNNNVFLVNRASSVCLHVEMGMYAGAVWCPEWDSYLWNEVNGQRMNASTQMFARDNLSLDKVLLEAGKVSIFDHDVYI